MLKFGDHCLLFLLKIQAVLLLGSSYVKSTTSAYFSSPFLILRIMFTEWLFSFFRYNSFGFISCFYCTGLDALLVVSLNPTARDEFSSFEFGKGFDYRTHLNIGKRDLGEILSQYLVSL